MKIAHVVRRLSFDDWGGTEQVVWNIAKAQLAAGHDVRVFATTALCPVSEETRDGIRISRFHPVYPWWPMPKAVRDTLDRKGGNPFVPRLGRALRSWRPDLLHCHAMGRITQLCIRDAERIGAKCLVSLHGGATNVPAAEVADLRAPTRRRLPWGKVLETALRWTRRVPEDADGIVCVGEDEYERWRTRHPHVLYLPNGVDSGLFARAAAARKSRAPGEARPFRVLCVARIDRQKDQMALVDWLGREPDARLRLVGPVTQPDYLTALKERAAALGAADRLSFSGALPPGSPELLAEYAEADAFALASRHEPFGIAVLEAWAAGLPVVASAAGGLGRLCARHSGAAISFNPGDAEALRSALARIRDDETLRADLCAAGMAAAAEYDWAAENAKLLDFAALL